MRSSFGRRSFAPRPLDRGFQAADLFLELRVHEHHVRERHGELRHVLGFREINRVPVEH
jgi:hypothetical protein